MITMFVCSSDQHVCRAEAGGLQVSRNPERWAGEHLKPFICQFISFLKSNIKFY